MTDRVVTFEVLLLGQAMLWVMLNISQLCCAPAEGFGLLSSTSALSDFSNAHDQRWQAISGKSRSLGII